MNLDNLLFIVWIAVPVCLAWKFKWLGFTIGMVVFWLIVCVCFWSRWELWVHPFPVISRFIPFSLVGFIGFAMRACVSSKRPVAYARRLLALIATVLVVAAASILMISLLLGTVDFCLGSFSRKPIFATNEDARPRDHTHLDGFGYKLVSFRKLEGKVGPVILYRFLPFTVSNTTEKFGVEWVLSYDDVQGCYWDSKWIELL